MGYTKTHKTIVGLRTALFGCLIVFVVVFIYYKYVKNGDKTSGIKNTRSTNKEMKTKRPKIQENSKNTTMSENSEEPRISDNAGEPKTSESSEEPKISESFEDPENFKTPEASSTSKTLEMPSPDNEPPMHNETDHKNEYHTTMEKIFNKQISPLTDELYSKLSTPLTDISKKLKSFNFNQEFITFLNDSSIKDKNLENFRSYLSKNVWMNKPTKYFDSTDKSLYKPNPLGHGGQTCFLVSLLHCIRSNGPLFEFFNLPNKTYPYFAPTFKKVVEQKSGSILETDFNNLVGTGDLFELYHYGTQENPARVLNTFFTKCIDSWAYMNLSGLRFFDICENAHINVDTMLRILNASHNYPILEVPILDNISSFNLQERLNGIELASKCSKCVEGDRKMYEFPLFTIAPPFLIFEFVEPMINVTSSQDFSIILQDNIQVPTLFDGVNEYEITGYIQYKKLRSNCGPYKAYVKTGNKWYECDGGSVNLWIRKNMSEIHCNDVTIPLAFYKKKE